MLGEQYQALTEHCRCRTGRKMPVVKEGRSPWVGLRDRLETGYITSLLIVVQQKPLISITIIYYLAMYEQNRSFG
jgi:hypothetical protein